MTEITYEKNPEYTEITLLGHCNAGRINGMDLCCCAVSMLVFTMLKTLGKYRLNGYTHSYGGGWCHVKFLNTSKDFEKGRTVTDSMIDGFGLLQKRYPSSVKLIIKENEVVTYE